MSEPAWYAEARRLYAECQNYSKVARRLGRPVQTVHSALTGETRRPGRQAQKNAWAEENYRGECVDCGASTRRREYSQCRKCYDAQRAECVHLRAQQVEGWWADGLTLQQIADRLGWSRGHLQGEFDRMRAAGYNLPYRYKPGKRHATKFADQVAT